MSISLSQPLIFEPLFMERIWGGRRLETVFGKRLPPGKQIGESWEIVDRPEAQSVVRRGPLAGKTLHQLWTESRAEVFGTDLPDTARFPLLLKLLDASAQLSLQVHPPETVAKSLGAEPKTEFWYFAACEPGAEIFAGLRRGIERDEFARAIERGSIAEHLHRIAIKAGDSFFVPSGRVHGIGPGNLIVEIQQNSDTTYRVFDWNRRDAAGEERPLHISESMQSIRFDDSEPECLHPTGEQLLVCPHFAVEKWDLATERSALDRIAFAIFVCLSDEVEAAGERFRAGDCFLIPACAGSGAKLRPADAKAEVLRVTLPSR